MNDADLRARLRELYLPPKDEIVLVDVPEMRFIMIDGHGARERTAIDHAVRWLFAILHPVRLHARERMGSGFVAPPLEGLWWADDPEDFVSANRERLNWRMMIVYEPDWLTAGRYEDAVASASARLGEPPASLRLDRYHEGLSAQTMFIGPGDEEGPTIARLHREFLPAHGLLPRGHHHEIYLTDPGRVAPEKRRTVLRQPVRSASCAGGGP